MTKQLAYYYRNREAVIPRMRDYQYRTGRTKGVAVKLRYCKHCQKSIPPRRGCKQEYHAECRLAVHRAEVEAAQQAQQAAQQKEQPQKVMSKLHRSLSSRVC